MQRQIRNEQNGASREGLNLAALRSMIVLCPPLEEQDRVCDRIDEETRGIVRAAKAIEEEITLLQEFRASVIREVVTGGVDVRSVAASLPEHLDGLEPLDTSDETANADDAEGDDFELEEAAA
jgi:type I restriction enzyme S subunit